MDEFRKLMIITKYQFMNHVRGKRLVALLLITAMMITLLLTVMWYYNSFEGMDALGFGKQWVSVVGFLTVMAALFFGGDAIAGEFHTGTAYYLLPNPVRRETLFFGKYAASVMAGLIVLGVYWVVGFATTLAYYGNIPGEFFESFSLNVLFLMSIMALSYFFSALFKTGTTSIVFTAVMYFFVFSIIETVAMFSGVEPWFSISYASNVINLVFAQDYSHTAVIGARRMNMYVFNPYIWEGTIIMLGYLAVSLLLGVWIFIRKDVT